MEKDLILTCDAGTGSCKCSVFNFRGEAICAVHRNYPTMYPQPNRAEQDPDAVLNAVFDGIRELLLQVSPQRIACIGLSAAMNGCIPVDENGNALHPNIIHSDSRTAKQVEQIASVIDPSDFYRLTGNPLATHYTLPKILWFKEHMPALYKKTRWFLNLKDYIYAHLTGRVGYTEFSDASLTVALDIKNRCWATELLTSLGIDGTVMPRILPGHDVRGKTTRKIYYRTGLITGTPVALGGGDGCCSGRGAGLADPGSACTYIGSSAWVSQIRPEPLFDPKARILNYLDADGKSCHATGTVQTGMSAFNWAVRNLMGGSEDSNIISRVENLARQVGPGAEGVLFLPNLMGSRTPYWDTNAKGVLMGFSLYHDRRHIARAIYEGIAFALNSCAEIISEHGTPFSSMMLTGDGARSGLWPNILSSVYGMTTQVHRTPGECSSLGAAMIAGVGSGIFRSYEDAANVVQVRSVHAVNPDWKDAYARFYPIYRDIYDHMRPLTDRISEQVSK